MSTRIIGTIYPISGDLGNAPAAIWVDPFTGKVWHPADKKFKEQSAVATQAELMVPLGNALTHTGGFLLKRPDGMAIDHVCDVLLFSYSGGAYTRVLGPDGAQRIGRVVGGYKAVNPEVYPHLK